MITEDYVSFETAKLLKEKGFNENTNCQYTLYGYHSGELGEYNITDRSRNPENYIPAPTLQMAMKWLREVHNITISITFEEDNRIYYELKKNGERKVGAATPLSYEDVCTEAINLCLKTLI